jgi:Flp pilus assembly protein TadD
MTARSEIAGLEALFSQALAHHREQRLPEARDFYRKILAQDPQQVVVWNHLGLASVADARDKAAWAIGRALRLAPTLAEGHSNLAAFHRGEGSVERAAESLRRAIVLQPFLAAPYNNLATLERDENRIAEAAGLFRRAAALTPGHPDIHCNFGAALLQLGEYEEGWREHEWRLHPQAMGASLRPSFDRPVWQGEDLAGRTLLLHAEQGFGDTLQFIRFAAPIAAKGGRVVVDAQPALTRLLATAAGVASVHANGTPLPDYDVHLPMMSAPHRLGVTLENLPAETPYLSVPAERREAWRQLLSGFAGLKVGLTWIGNPGLKLGWTADANARRSIPLARLAPLLDIPGTTFFSLQKDAPAPGLVDFMAEMGDFADTAALVDALDLVITVDTSVAHLAGALDKPVWILSRFDGCWRWLGHRADSPWYRSARLFHQNTRDDWAPVIDEVAAALRDLVKKTH